MQLVEPAGLVHQRHRAATGIELHVVERSGTGIPVLLLHGIWGSWRSWLPLLALDADPFGGRPVRMVDLRGHGSSSKPPRGYGLRDYAGDVITLIRAFDGPVVLGGHSLGALTALAAAREVADRIAAMVLEEPPLPLPSDTGDLDSIWSTFAEAVVNLSVLKHEPLDVIVAKLMAEYPDLSRTDAEEAAVSLSLSADGVFSAVMMGEFGGNDEVLPPEPLEVPTLVYQGGLPDDRMLTDFGVAMLRPVLPRLDLIHFADTGHSIHYARPAEFGAAVAGFFESALTP